MRVVSLALVAGLIASAQTIKELKLKVEPDGAVRPGETAVVQVQVFGTLSDGRKGRLRLDGWTASTSGGTLSKPFRYQGDDAGDYLEKAESGFARILGQGLAQFTMKDAVLFVAPAAAGKYPVTVTMQGVRANTSIEVKTDAATRVPQEKVTFPALAKSADPYRKLAEHYAPVIAQETWFEPKADYLARFDYDGDWRGDNNWDNLTTGSSQAWVHYAAMETETHVFLLYNFFHPRDYSDNCVLGSCHENDNEGMIVAVQKDGTEFGRLQLMETLAHNNIYSYVNDASLRPGWHPIAGNVVLRDGTHPVIFLEAGGHGAYSAGDSRSLYDVARDQFVGSGVTYVYKGTAERPRSPMDREVGYDLLSIHDEWWARSLKDDAITMFDEFYVYEPFGGRPRMKTPRISGAFLGRKQASNKARPFWGWFDTRARKAGIIATGQWALDPAWSMARNVVFPEGQRYSLKYTWNAFLDIGTPELSMRAPADFVAAAPIPEGGVLTPSGSTQAAGQDPSPLGQILNDSQRDAIAGALSRVGVGIGGSDGLSQVAEMLGVRPTAGQCTLTVHAKAGMNLVLRGSAAEGAGVSCNRPLPAGVVRLRMDVRSGPASPALIETPSATNEYSAKLRFEQAGDYVVVLTW